MDTNKQSGSFSDLPPKTPRWVKAFGIIVLLLVIVIGVMLLSGGEHGPGRHTPAIEQSTQQP